MLDMKYAIALLMCIPVAACTTIPTAPVEVAETTVLDERAGIAAEDAYKLVRTLMESAVDLGLVRGQLAAQLITYDTRAFSALEAMRTAYRTGNAQTYEAAAGEVMLQTGLIQSLLRSITNVA